MVRKSTRPYLTKEERREQQLLHERNEKERRRRERARALRRQKANTVYMIFGAAAIVAGLVCYISMTNSIITHKKAVESLQTQIEELELSVAATQSRIDTATNLAEVKAIAIEELGMDYATAEQIVYYSIQSDDYMSQYQAIP